MKALSLTRPWGWIILHLGKRIENRSWNTDYRGPVLLHSSKTMTERDWYTAHDFVRRFDPEGATRIPQPKDPVLRAMAIIGRAELAAIIYPGFKDKFGNVITEPWLVAQRPWYMGQFGFVLKNVRPTPIVACKGTHKLWDAPADVVRQALGRAA